MNILRRLLGKGCSHNFSWPRLYTDGLHYQTCSQCGRSYEYDWTLMRRTDRLKAANVPVHLLAHETPARHAKSL
jgi:hypothetical protein